MTSDEERKIGDFTLSPEYACKKLEGACILEECFAEFRIFLARGIIRNTGLYSAEKILNESKYKETSNKLISMIHLLGEFGRIFQ